MDKASSLAAPKYERVKDTFQIFDLRINELKKNIHFHASKNYFVRMKDIRNRVFNLLKTYKSYDGFYSIKKSDPIYGEIPNETLYKLTELSKPRKKDLKSALMMINKMIRSLKSDIWHQHNDSIIKRYDELLEYRKQICCLIGNYKYDYNSLKCHRFASCKKKIINIWEIPNKSKPNSRFLKFCFDESTNTLAHPKCRSFQESLASYFLQSQYNVDSKSKLMLSEKDIEKFNAEIIRINRKIGFITKSMACNFSEQNQDNSAKDNNVFKGYTNRIELPLRKRLENSLELYEHLLTILQKKSIEGDEIETGKIKPLPERIERNIIFLNQLLQKSPKPKEHCQVEEKREKKPSQKKIINIIRDNSGRIIEYNFDVKTTEMAFPKLSILEAAYFSHLKILKKYEMDLKNIAFVKNEMEKSQNESENNEVIENRNMDLQYSGLQKRINRLKVLIAKKKELIVFLQKTESSIGMPTNFYHQKVCLVNTNPKFPPNKHQMSKPYRKVTSSIAPKRFYLSSYKVFEDLIEKRRKWIEYKHEIEHIFKTSAGNQIIEVENDNEINNSRESLKQSYTRRIITKKLKLEKLIQTLNADVEENAHWFAHKKLERNDIFRKNVSSDTQVNMERIEQLALPKNLKLKKCLYKPSINEDMKNFLKCNLSKYFCKPEQIENLYHEEVLIAKPKSKSRSNKNPRLCQLFLKISESDFADLNQFVSHCILSALNIII